MKVVYRYTMENTCIHLFPSARSIAHFVYDSDDINLQIDEGVSQNDRETCKELQYKPSDDTSYPMVYIVFPTCIIQIQREANDFTGRFFFKL